MCLIPYTYASLILNPITVPEIEKIISHLLKKTSHGHDQISNTLLKQGSCLGPLLFLFFCNDIYGLPTYSKIILFADNTSLLYSHKSVKFLRFALEHDMKLLTNWYRANKLSLNIAKTVLLKFWPEGKCFDLEIKGVQIENAHQTRFLGVLIDDCLSWKGHVNQLINKINVNKKLLSNAKTLLPILVLKNIYHAHIYSHMTYGLVV